jgi:hypothetical protein
MNIRELSSQEFLQLGVNHIAYIKSVNIAGAKVYAVQSADGKTLYLEESFDMAVGALQSSDLNGVLLH